MTEHIQRGPRRTVGRSALHEKDPGSKAPAEDPLAADIRLSFRAVESAIYSMVSAINRGANKAQLTEQNVIHAIARAQRLVKQYTQLPEQPKEKSSAIETEFAGLLAQAESALLEFTTPAERHLRGQFMPDCWDLKGHRVQQLQRLNLTMEQPVPEWMTAMLANLIADRQVKAAVWRPTAIDKARKQYAAAPPGAGRARQAKLMTAIEMICASSAIAVDGREHHAKEVYDSWISNAEFAAEDAAEYWQSRVPALAQQYDRISQQTPQLAELNARSAEFFIGPGVDQYLRRIETAVMGSLKEKPNEDKRGYALIVSMEQTSKLVNDLYTLAENGVALMNGRVIETRLWQTVQGMEKEMDGLRKTMTDQGELDRYEAAYFHTVGKCEKVLNAVDASQWMKIKNGDVIDTVRQATIVSEEREDMQVYTEPLSAVEQVCQNNDTPLPGFVKQWIAHAYYALDHQARSEDDKASLDAPYEYSLAFDSGSIERRVLFREILPGLLRRAGTTFAMDHTDEEGDQHRAKQVLEQLIELWETAYPPIAEKYKLLAKYWPLMIDTVMNLDLHDPLKKQKEERPKD